MEQKFITIDVPTTVAVRKPEPKKQEDHRLSTLYALIAAVSIVLNIILAVAR